MKRLTRAHPQYVYFPFFPIENVEEKIRAFMQDDAGRSGCGRTAGRYRQHRQRGGLRGAGDENTLSTGSELTFFCVVRVNLSFLVVI